MATEAAGVGLWSWNVDTNEITLDDPAHVMWGVPNVGTITFEDLSARIHPEDLDRVRAAFFSTRTVIGAYETDFRILHGDEIRWISARGRGEDEGIEDHIMFGVFLDVSVRKRAEEAREMIATEMSHRIKNLFAIASALTSIAARSTTTKEEMVHDLTQRLTALSDAHDLVHSLPGQPKKIANLGKLLAVILKPYAEEISLADRVQISAPEMLVGETSATALTLILHELATNSIKYGALSTKDGALDLSCTVRDSDVVIIWTEKGGPSVSTPSRSGFGSQLITRSVSGQLGGSITTEWEPGGAIITLRMSKTRIGV